jgi:cell division transport system permease protein
MNYSLFRAFKYAFKDFWRNFWLSLVTITVLVLALLSLNILISLNVISTRIISSVEDKVDVSVYFKPGTEIAKIDNFQTMLKGLPEVKSVEFVSKDIAYETFKTKHADDPNIMAALKELEKNPLVDAVTIKGRTIDDYNKIIAVIGQPENSEIIKFQNYTDHQKIIEKMGSISAKVEKISLVLTIVFALIAVLIVFNAIRVMIYTHKDEIIVMKLVGANNRFIRAPFIMESLLFSVFSLALTVVLLYAVLGALSPYLVSFFNTYDFDLILYYNENFAVLFGLQFIFVLLLNAISSGIAIGRYLKV